MGISFLAQGAAAVVSFLARDTVIATAMAVLALTWLVVGATLFRSPPGVTSDALGLQLIVSATAMALIALTETASGLVAALVFGTASIRFAVTALYELTDGNGWKETAGVVGLILSSLAVYGAWAALLEASTGRTVLPLGRRGRGAIALSGGRLQQVEDIAHQPGVRIRL